MNASNFENTVKLVTAVVIGTLSGVKLWNFIIRTKEVRLFMV